MSTTRLALDPRLDVTVLSDDPKTQGYLRAMQTYGVYVGDSAETITDEWQLLAQERRAKRMREGRYLA